MIRQLENLKESWTISKMNICSNVNNDAISSFQLNNKLLLPEDLIEYFKTLNGTQKIYDQKFFQFYSLDQFKQIHIEYENWEGVPNYRDIVNTLKEYENYFVFADYQIHLFSYVIRLYPDKSINNEVLVVCGSDYKHIANSFKEFLDLYLSESIELQL
jgi:hypothetical protein